MTQKARSLALKLRKILRGLGNTIYVRLTNSAVGAQNLGWTGHQVPLEGEDESTSSLYRVFYSSTRQKGNVAEPYGQNDYSDKAAAERSRDKLMRSKDMYRIEIWGQLETWKGTIHVEEYHGNPVHLRRRLRQVGKGC